MHIIKLRHLHLAFFLTIGVFVSGISASGAIGEMLHKSYRDRVLIYRSQFRPRLLDIQSPTEKLRLLDAWMTEAKEANDQGAELELMMSRYKILEESEMITVDEKIAAQTALLATVNAKRYPEYAVRLMVEIGNMYFGKKRNFTLAFEQFINAYNLSSELGSERFPDKQHNIVTIGNRYYSLGDLDRARTILLEADTMLCDSPQMNRYNIKNTLGLIFRSRGRYDSAIMLFTEARRLAIRDSNALWASIARGNIGICHYLSGDYAKAIPLLEEDIAISLQPQSLAEDNGVNSLLILGDIHLKQGRPDLLKDDLARARYWLVHCRDQIRPRSLLFPLEAKYYAGLGDYKKAYIAQDSASFYKDSLLARDNIFKVARMDHERDLEHQETRLRRLESERQLAIYTRNSLLGGVALLSIIAFLGISRQRLRSRERHRKLIQEREHAEEELRSAGEKLSSYSQHLDDKNALIERSADEIQKLQTQIAANRNAAVKNDILQQLYNSTILTDDEWLRFKVLFEQVHPGYLQHLKMKLPELTPADTRFLVLQKLGLNNKEMSAVLGVASDTIRSYRHRLKKRFEPSDDPEILDLIGSI